MDLKYYFSLFVKRLPYFLTVALLISAISILVAGSLPPVFESRMRLIVESSAISSDSLTTPAMEQLQIVEQRLMTRKNLIDIAERLNVLDVEDRESPDRIVEAMRDRTSIFKSAPRNEAALMVWAFESSSPITAAAVLEEYLALITAEDEQIRDVRVSQNLEFFEEEVQRLNEALAESSAKILKFKLDNSDALPESLDFLLNQQSSTQERIAQMNREIDGFKNQREKLLVIFDETGTVKKARLDEDKSADELFLETLQSELAQALAIYSRENPKVRVLESRIKQTEAVIARKKKEEGFVNESRNETTGNSTLDFQLADIDTRLAALNEQRGTFELQLAEISAALTKTPANTIRLNELELNHSNLQSEYTDTTKLLTAAKADALINKKNQSQKITLIEPPAIPNEPSKPNRMLIAGGGTFLGIMAGLALVTLLELLNKTVRRPEDLVNKLGLEPLATLPYIRSRKQMIIQRSWKVAGLLAIVVVIPTLIYTVHSYYLPLDQLLERVFLKAGLS